MQITTEQASGPPVEALLGEAQQAQMLVLGSRVVGPVSGFFLGSVSMTLAATAPAPVVLVRTGSGSAGGGDVVVGLALRRPCDSVLGFAFDTAALRGVALRAVHAGRVPPVRGYAPWIVDVALREAGDRGGRTLSEALVPWREKFPQVAVCEEVALDSPSRRLVNAASDAALLVVGRGPHRVGAGPRLGPVGQAVLHHAACQVAVIPS